MVAAAPSNAPTKSGAIADPEKEQIINNVLGVIRSSNPDASVLLSFGLKGGKITGRYRAGTQVYEYEVSPDSLTDVPIEEGRGDSYLRGYYSGFSEAIASRSIHFFRGWLARFDAASPTTGVGFGKKPQCTPGKSRLCGGACIPLKGANGKPKRCRFDPSPKEKQTIIDTIRMLDKRQQERSPAAPTKQPETEQKPVEPEKPATPTPTKQAEPKQSEPKKPAHQNFIETGDRLIPDDVRQKLDALTTPSAEKAKLRQMLAKIKAGLQSDKIKGEQREKLKEAGRKALKRHQELEQQEAKVAEQAMKQVRDRLLQDAAKQYGEEAKAFAKGIDIDDKAAGIRNANEMRRDAMEYYLLTKGKGAGSIKKLTYERDRASANPEKEVVDVGKSPTKQILFHEMAHHMEYNNPAIASAAIGWIRSRSSSPPQKLKDITGNQRYRDNEVAYQDKFLSPYVGKVYPVKGKDGKVTLRPATEAISMAVERMATPADMVNFYRQDPEHFKFVLGILAS